MISTSIVFFGSGPVARDSLVKLMRHVDIEAVITKPRPPHHHGPVPVIDLAEANQLPIFTASNRQELDDLIRNTTFQSSAAVLVDFGIIVGGLVIEAFADGIINSHFSLLPKLRGADPITWSIINGDNTTGVSLMMVDTSLDTGKLLAQKAIPIEDTDTSITLTSKLIDLSDSLLVDTLPAYLAGKVTPTDQVNPDSATYSRKLDKSDGVIDWQEPAELIERKVRAFIEWPKSHAKLYDIDVIICSTKVRHDLQLSSGAVSINNESIIVGTADYGLEILTLKPVGKKLMSAKDFLLGYGASFKY